MTSAVELLLVFISLEISSISTYILAAFRKRTIDDKIFESCFSNKFFNPGAIEAHVAILLCPNSW